MQKEQLTTSEIQTLSLKDKNNIIYKYPERSCLQCKKRPCFKGFDFINVDFAKYGCLNFVSDSISSNGDSEGIHSES